MQDVRDRTERLLMEADDWAEVQFDPSEMLPQEGDFRAEIAHTGKIVDIVKFGVNKCLVRLNNRTKKVKTHLLRKV